MNEPGILNKIFLFFVVLLMRAGCMSDTTTGEFQIEVTGYLERSISGETIYLEEGDQTYKILLNPTVGLGDDHEISIMLEKDFQEGEIALDPKGYYQVSYLESIGEDHFWHAQDDQGSLKLTMVENTLTINIDAWVADSLSDEDNWIHITGTASGITLPERDPNIESDQ
jgi:hypothetical protein